MSEDQYYDTRMPPYGIGTFAAQYPASVSREELLEARQHYFDKYRTSVRTKEALGFLTAMGPHKPSDPLPPISSPADVIREMTSLALMTLGRPMPGLHGADAEAASLFLAPLIWEAMPFFWTTDVWKSVEAMAKDIPDHIVSTFELGSETSVYWCLQHAEMVGFDVKGVTREAEMSGILLSSSGAKISWNLIGSTKPTPTDETQPVALGGVIASGSRFPDDYEEDARLWVSIILAGLAFLESPYIPKSTRRMERGIRKRFMAAGEPFQDVTFVDLRPVSRRDTYGEGVAGDGNGRDYNCRWIVRGHWREQWYPSLGCHKLIYIPPYVKGPEDKPLKQTVYRVVR